MSRRQRLSHDRDKILTELQRTAPRRSALRRSSSPALERHPINGHSATGDAPISPAADNIKGSQTKALDTRCTRRPTSENPHPSASGGKIIS